MEALPAFLLTAFPPKQPYSNFTLPTLDHEILQTTFDRLDSKFFSQRMGAELTRNKLPRLLLRHYKRIMAHNMAGSRQTNNQDAEQNEKIKR